MESTYSSNSMCKQQNNFDENKEKYITQLKQSLPNEPWFNGEPMYLYQGFWVNKSLDSIIAFQNHFRAQDEDIFVISSRKTGTTWLKSLIFAISDRGIRSHSPSESPLLKHNPHALVPQLESNIYDKSKFPDLVSLKSPRLFGTHVPFQALASSIKDSKAKIIYISRNPLDTMISSFLFYQNVSSNQTLKADMLDVYADMFCDGKIPFGPFEDHVLGYWRKSLEIPEKILFIKYEDLKADQKPELKRMAEFIERPFSKEEEDMGLIDEIINLCSFQKLKQIAKPENSVKVYSTISNELFFRKGVVGDWINYMSPLMAEKFNKIMEEKFSGSGLTSM